ncbi:hypothetical protein PABG_11127 [Paracoccidioides brasiliensis Pb03]|nr:hypothetical protein PABG_11127 [Paracoccidioides brasiliensis Pb03]
MPTGPKVCNKIRASRENKGNRESNGERAGWGGWVGWELEDYGDGESGVARRILSWLKGQGYLVVEGRLHGTARNIHPLGFTECSRLPWVDLWLTRRGDNCYIQPRQI